MAQNNCFGSSATLFTFQDFSTCHMYYSLLLQTFIIRLTKGNFDKFDVSNSFCHKRQSVTLNIESNVFTNRLYLGLTGKARIRILPSFLAIPVFELIMLHAIPQCYNQLVIFPYDLNKKTMRNIRQCQSKGINNLEITIQDHYEYVMLKAKTSITSKG